MHFQIIQLGGKINYAISLRLALRLSEYHPGVPSRSRAKQIRCWHGIARLGLMDTPGVESEADITTIGVYTDLPNVYRMKDIVDLKVNSFLKATFLSV